MTVAQRTTALAKANDIRHKRHVLKEALKHGEVLVTPFLREPPDWLSSMLVWDLLRSVKGIGLVKAGRLLHRCQISDLKTLESLSERQREKLMTAVEGR
jgi:hypothetical protein